MYIMNDYDEALERILHVGIKKEDRTGVGTISYHGLQCAYNIDAFYPLITKRRVWPKSVIAELLWFLSGSTNNEDLIKLGCNFWTPWVDRDFEEKFGYVRGSFGPTYGFQLRHSGGVYRSGDKNDKMYGNGGVDQLKNMVETLKTNPNCRRNMFDLWSPKETHKMRLPPCHFNFQVLVRYDEIDGILTQRSCDYPVGVPANIQFYSTLIMMLAQQTGLKPGQLIHNTNDSHIYLNQIDAVEEYLSRPKTNSPTIEINKAKDIYSYTPEDFKILDYDPQNKIHMEIAV